MTTLLSDSDPNASVLLHLEMAMAIGNVARWEMELPSGKILFNENKTRMIGMEAKDFTHYKHFTDLVHPDDYERIMAAMRAHLDGTKDLYETEYRIKHKNGTYRWFYDRGRIVERGKEGKVLAMGIVQDVTDFKEAILNLKNETDELKKLNAHMLDRELRMGELKNELLAAQALLAAKGKK